MLITVTLATGACVAVPAAALGATLLAGPNAVVHAATKTTTEIGSRTVSGIASGACYVGSLLSSALFFWQSSDENEEKVNAENGVPENSIEESKEGNGADK